MSTSSVTNIPQIIACHSNPNLKTTTNPREQLLQVKYVKEDKLQNRLNYLRQMKKQGSIGMLWKAIKPTDKTEHHKSLSLSF